MRNPAQIAEGAMGKLRENIRAAMEDRGKNATGGTSQRINVATSGGNGSGQASLLMDQNWRYLGNGRGPGKPPPIGSIRAWIAARGLPLNAFALAHSIGKRGSLDFRRRNKNIPLEEIAAWRTDEAREATEEFADNLKQQVIETIDKTFN